jgi:hypothetical protein
MVAHTHDDSCSPAPSILTLPPTSSGSGPQSEPVLHTKEEKHKCECAKCTCPVETDLKICTLVSDGERTCQR